jgi:YesN/AraC family two-component response regulator
MHGGDVSVLSAEGEGAIFTLAIPLVSDATADLREDVAQETPVDSFKWEKIAEDASSRVNTEADDASSMEKEFRVLLVDDNDDMLSFLREIFSADYEIVTGRNGREAMDILIGTDDLPDIIVSDVMMPEMDGFELAESVRTDRRFEGIPILLLTARTDVPDRLTGFRRGATDYIAKPFNARELLARANAQIHLKILRDRLARTNERLYDKLKAATGEEAQPVSDASREKVAKVIEFIKENYDTDLSREGLAAAVGLSPDHFSRIFNQVTGSKIAEYVNGLRVAEAEKRLVESDATVTEIAYAVGFDTVKTFNRAFRKITGITPSEYRVRN